MDERKCTGNSRNDCKPDQVDSASSNEEIETAVPSCCNKFDSIPYTQNVSSDAIQNISAIASGKDASIISIPNATLSVNVNIASRLSKPDSSSSPEINEMDISELDIYRANEEAHKVSNSDEGSIRGISGGLEPQNIHRATFSSVTETTDNQVINPNPFPGGVQTIPFPDSVESKVRRARFKGVLDNHTVKGPGNQKLRLELEEFAQEDLEIGEDENLILVLVEKRLLAEEPVQIEPPPRQKPTMPSILFRNHYGSYYSPQSGFSPSLEQSLKLFRKDISDSDCDFYHVEKNRTNAPKKHKASIIKAKYVYKSDHEDGLGVLALRRLFQEMKTKYRNFRGVILVGAFPEAFIVRRWQTGNSPWSLAPEGSPYYEQYKGSVTFGNIAEEVLAFRSDLVLADLDGKWDSIYHRGPRKFHMSPPKGANLGGKAEGVGGENHTAVEMEDFFLIDEVDENDKLNFKDPEVGLSDEYGKYWNSAKKKYVPGFQTWRKTILSDDSEINEQLYTYSSLLYRCRKWNPRLKPSDKSKEHIIVNGTAYEFYHDTEKVGIPYKANQDGNNYIVNILAKPDIIVSRINARHVAVSLNPSLGRKKRWDWDLVLGDPCSIQSKTGIKSWKDRLKTKITGEIVHDPYFERELLIDYFSRNHAYRIKAAGVRKVGTMWASSYTVDDWGHELSSQPEKRAFSEYWTYDTGLMHDFDGYNQFDGTFEDALDWLRKPALLRFYYSHGMANSLGTTPEYDCFVTRPITIYTPYPVIIFKEFPKGYAWRGLDFSDLREVYERIKAVTFGRSDEDMQKKNASFYYLIQSYNNSPVGAYNEPYNSLGYGEQQIAEACLFFGEGLALLSRSHSYHDHPASPMEDRTDWQSAEKYTTDTYVYTLLRGYCFGESWRARFEEHQSWRQIDLGTGKELTYHHWERRHLRKEPYRMVILGDWTLRLNDYVY